jgi:hypothetical protein
MGVQGTTGKCWGCEIAVFWEGRGVSPRVMQVSLSSLLVEPCLDVWLDTCGEGWAEPPPSCTRATATAAVHTRKRMHQWGCTFRRISG